MTIKMDIGSRVNFQINNKPWLRWLFCVCVGPSISTHRTLQTIDETNNSLKSPICLDVMKPMKLWNPFQSCHMNLEILLVTTMATVTMNHCQNYLMVKVFGIMVLSILYLRISQVLMIMLPWELTGSPSITWNSTLMVTSSVTFPTAQTDTPLL